MEVVFSLESGLVGMLATVGRRAAAVGLTGSTGAAPMAAAPAVWTTVAKGAVNLRAEAGTTMPWRFSIAASASTSSWAD